MARRLHPRGVLPALVALAAALGLILAGSGRALVPTVPTMTSSVVTLNGMPVTSVPLGSSVVDHAVVTPSSGTNKPTGTVSFAFYSAGNCNGTPTSAGTASLSGGAADSNSVVLGSVQTFAFQATYPGTIGFGASTGPCELITAVKASTSMVTAIGCCGTTVTTVPAGTTVSDQAIVVTSVAGIQPRGTVDFDFFTNAACSGQPSLTRNGPVSNWTATTGPVGPLAAGSYSFLATYNGDENFDGSTAPCEPLTVTGSSTASSTLATAITVGGPPVTTALVGAIATDHATLTVPAGGPAPTGTISFSFYTTGSCDGPSTSAGTSPVGGGSSDAQGPLAAGGYSFRASYNGDSHYASSTSPCEVLTVGLAGTTIDTTIKTKPNGKVYDVATVSGELGSIPITGSVSFLRYATSNCSGHGTPAGTSFLLNSSAKSAAKKPPAGGVFSFQATYSGDNNYSPSTGPCESPAP
jgi:hypothetical protein